ncbi:MAG TPA: S9 family peptidase [Terriglobales bacterium]|jgi:dipeptidyl aminopeptidase/acylaminoacyl peptidase|nr:S9 family peptidase [Terriglobales bacterium]
MTPRRRLLLPVLLSAVFAISTAAETKVRNFDQAAISPDGKRVAWIGPAEAPTGADATVTVNGLYVQALDNPAATPQRINTGTFAKSTIDGVAWSVDSRMLAFLCEVSEQMQVCVSGADGQSPRKITDLKGALADPAWSPDGKQVAFLFIENAPRKPGPLEAMTPETGVIESKIYEQRLAVLDVNSGAVRQISPPEMYVYEFNWSPDGKQFALTAAPGEGDANWYTAQLYRLPAMGGSLVPVYKPPLQMAVPRWSPDGKNIAFIAGLMSDEGSTGGDIFVVPAEGGEARNVTPGIPGSPSWLTWQSADKILFAGRFDGDAGIATVDVGTRKVTQVWRGPESILKNESISVSADATRSAIIRHSAAKPPEVWAGPTGAWKQITRANEEVRPGWGDVKSVHWTSDNMNVQGWLAYPVGFDPNHVDPKHRYPMVVVVHGGPAGASASGWPGSFFSSTLYALTKEGYFVLFPNPRGSYGQGEAFVRGNVKDFGGGDLRDILAGVDSVVKTQPVDNDRIGITGWSYGGYMTMWAITQTNRFRAAVSGAGLSNFQSYYGQNDIDQWMIPYFGASVYDDPAVYARSSPMTFIKNVKTPTLIVVGDRDGEVPAPQSREFWHALKALGVETQYVVYEGEGHSIQKAEHRKDIGDRLVAWFNRFLKPEPGKTQ